MWTDNDRLCCRRALTVYRLKESGAINKSLFVLGEVVDAINNNLVSSHHCVYVITVTIIMWMMVITVMIMAMMARLCYVVDDNYGCDDDSHGSDD